MCSGMLMACFLFLFSETRLVEIMDNLCSETEVSSLNEFELLNEI